MRYFTIFFTYCFVFIFQINKINAQICGVSGLDGPTNASSVINTYYPPLPNITLSAGSTSVQLQPVPPTDRYGNSFGTVPISAGDLIIIIQMQDGSINTTNSRAYGSGNINAGPDALGGSGYTSLGNAGKYEYLIALNNVSLTGGTLQFRGASNNSGLVNTYINASGDGSTVGQKTFQVVRVPQFSSLTLTKNISAPPFNGRVGGLIGFDVAGDFNFNGFLIDASARGFRGGYQSVQVSNCTSSNTYVTSTDIIASGKGEGIAGTPRYMWDGYNEVDNGVNSKSFPGFYFGRGAPANAGGGGNDHNSGGGGGGNGGWGGVGGLAWQGAGACSGDPGNPSGGRPGAEIPSTAPDKMFLGGGGGGGDANNATTGTKGGVGGGIILINAGRITGAGTIMANGGNGDRGAYLGAPDGAGGGGAGGTIVVRVLNNSSNAQLNLLAKGGRGGNTANDRNNEHGPGGGGGGGVIWHSIPQAAISTDVQPGQNGLSNDGGAGAIPHGAATGKAGKVNSFSISNLPIHLQGMGANCFPSLTVLKSEIKAGVAGSRPAGNPATYIITVQNKSSGGGAGGVRISDKLPAGFEYLSSSAVYTGGAAGNPNPTNHGSTTNIEIGDFTIPAGGSVTVTVNVYINMSVPVGVYHNGAQALYLDPTRTLSSPTRRITPLLYSLSGQNTSYQSGVNLGVIVPGQNYDGQQNGPSAEDVHIIARGNIVSAFSVCSGGSVQLNVTPPDLTPPFSYQWTGPGTFSPSSNAQNPTITNVTTQNSGIYTVIVTDANGFNSTYSTTVTVDQSVKIPPISAVICSGDKFLIDPVSVTPGNIIPPGTKYSWTVTPNLNVTGQSDQSIPQTNISQTLTNLTNTIQNVVYTVMPSVTSTCTMEPFVVTISVKPPQRLIDQEVNICSGSQFNIQPQLVGGNPLPSDALFTWTVLPNASVIGQSGQTQGQSNISQRLTNLTNSSKVVVYQATLQSSGCTSLPFTIKVNVDPTPIIPNQKVEICTENPFTISIDGSQPNSIVPSGTSYKWSAPIVTGGMTGGASGNGNSISGLLVNQTSLVQTASYSVTPTSGINPVCVGPDFELIVHVNPKPNNPNVNASSAYICEGSSTTLSASGGSTYNWFFNGSQIPGVNNQTFNASSPGTYHVVAVSAFGCKSVLSQNIVLTVINKPNVDFSFNSYCLNTITKFKNLTKNLPGGPLLWEWDFGDNNKSNIFEPEHLFSKAQQYNVTLSVTPQQCPSLISTITKKINIEQPSKGIRYPTKNVVINLPTRLEARQIGITYKWLPVTGLNNNMIFNPTLNTDKAVDYKIEILTRSGCVIVDTLLVQIFSSADIQVPKAFSPNGDGNNDLLDIFLIGVEKLLFFRVFNRWGQLMYETRDPRQLWDGKFNGIKQPIETYVWIAEAIGTDGSKITRRGQSLLIK